MDSKAESAGLLPPEFIGFIKLSATLGLIAALVLTSALVYKGVEKIFGKEGAKKYRWIVILVDILVLIVFAFIYITFF